VAVNGENMVKLIEDIIDEAEIELTRQKIKKIDRKLLLDNVLNNVVGKWQIATAQEMPILMKNKLKIRILKDPKFDKLVKKFGEE
jgi:signal transduction histidine kinase